MLIRFRSRLASASPNCSLPHCFFLRGLSSYQQPLVEKGKIPAFDEALGYFESQGVQPSHFSAKEAFRNGMADFSKPEFQKLGLQHFIEYRRDKLVHLAKQRHVYADYFPSADLNAEVHIATRNNELLKYCEQYAPSILIDPPQVQLQVYHPEERLYTFLVLDGDYPYAKEQQLREHVLWMKVNHKLSASSVSEGTEVHTYIPPHPTKGTGKHRIVTLLLEQAQEIHTFPQRDMIVWNFIKEHQLKPRGLHLFYSYWDTSVATIFADFMKQREPEFVPAPKVFDDGLDKNTFLNI